MLDSRNLARLILIYLFGPYFGYEFAIGNSNVVWKGFLGSAYVIGLLVLAFFMAIWMNPEVEDSDSISVEEYSQLVLSRQKDIANGRFAISLFIAFGLGLGAWIGKQWCPFCTIQWGAFVGATLALIPFFLLTDWFWDFFSKWESVFMYQIPSKAWFFVGGVIIFIILVIVCSLYPIKCDELYSIWWKTLFQ